MGWREAWTAAAYGPGGFYARGEAPAAHFRTSVHASPLFAEAVGTLLDRVDAALGRPDLLDLVDVGAGRGELLAAVAGADRPYRDRLRLLAVEVWPLVWPACHSAVRASVSSCAPVVPFGKRAVAIAIWPFSTRVKRSRKRSSRARGGVPIGTVRVMSVVPSRYCPPESIR